VPLGEGSCFTQTHPSQNSLVVNCDRKLFHQDIKIVPEMM